VLDVPHHFVLGQRFYLVGQQEPLRQRAIVVQRQPVFGAVNRNFWDEM